MADSSSLELPLPKQYDMRRTLWLAGMGTRDPTCRFSDSAASLAYQTPAGPVSILADRTHDNLHVECVGAGADWVMPRLPALFGLQDRPETFQPDGKLGELVKQTPGVHLPTVPLVFHRLVQIVLQQLVSWNDALYGWRQIVRRFGSEAPCGTLRLPPTARRLRELGYYDIVQCSVMPKQARLILRLARESERIERLAHEGHESLGRFLLSMNGIGPWTEQHLLGSSCGFADAVLTGDFGLPHTISHFLIGKARSNDEEMLELLEPYAGNRFRVINYLWQDGKFAPRFGPRMRTNRWRFRRGGSSRTSP